jgi:hypothetical protein
MPTQHTSKPITPPLAFRWLCLLGSMFDVGSMLDVPRFFINQLSKLQQAKNTYRYFGILLADIHHKLQIIMLRFVLITVLVAGVFGDVQLNVMSSGCSSVSGGESEIRIENSYYGAKYFPSAKCPDGYDIKSAEFAYPTSRPFRSFLQGQKMISIVSGRCYTIVTCERDEYSELSRQQEEIRAMQNSFDAQIKALNASYNAQVESMLQNAENSNKQLKNNESQLKTIQYAFFLICLIAGCTVSLKLAASNDAWAKLCLIYSVGKRKIQKAYIAVMESDEEESTSLTTVEL